MQDYREAMIKNVKNITSKWQNPSLLSKVKSTPLIQIKSDSILTHEKSSVSSCICKQLNRQECYSGKNHSQCSHLSIQSQLSQGSYFEYYPPSNEPLSKKVSFAEEREKIRGPSPSQCMPQAKKRNSSILKNGSLSKISRSNSQVSLRSISIDKNIKMSSGHPNLTVLNKFKTTLAQLQSQSSKSNNLPLKSEDKFTDSIFPPVYSSLFTVQSNSSFKKRIGSQIVWKRIPQIYPNKRIIIKALTDESESLLISPGKYSSQYFVEGLNAIKRSQSLINYLFREHINNNYGVYCVRFFSQNGWRHIMIDDFIPAIKMGEYYVPAFTNIDLIASSNYRGKNLQIWPLLLQKAYASYYGTYESLKYGRLKDFLEEITGSMMLQIPKAKEKICQMIYINPNLDQKENKNPTQQSNNYEGIEFQQKFYIFCKIIPPKDISKRIKPETYLRKITVKQISNLNIMIRQKDERFYHHSAVFYSYIWNRVILLYKEYDSNFSWIDGAYSNQKSINFVINNAKAGEYYLIVMPQWKVVHRHQITLMVSSDCSDQEGIQLENQPYNDSQKILEKGCSDLAQRVGTLQQLNKITCSYKYIHMACGLIIESIHNQRISGEIAIQREWKTKLKSLIPFNSEFGQQGNQGRVELIIDKNSHYTFVILLINGKTTELQHYKF